jgi:glutamate-1-semialdehyde 2,1-aminomutase
MATRSVAGTIDERLGRQNRGSAELYERARETFPSGVTHDSRYQEPFPLYVERAQGSRKWDVDGNEYVDYFGGHGALLLGHSHPAVTAAVVEQAARGSHYGAGHELEIRWGELVRQIVPSAERVKFTSSGTEATLMAMRLARAFSGKSIIVKMQGHFHGWHDYATIAMAPPYDEPISSGIPPEVRRTVRAVPPPGPSTSPDEALEALRAALEPGDVAGVILLCNGLGTEFLSRVRELTRELGVLLIFDEVVSGFRYAPGGAQEYFGVTPDLTSLAKILAGGYPGGAVVGRADILALFEFRDDPQWQRFGRIAHPGTYNANPVSAAAGVAALEIVRDPAVQQRANATAQALRTGIDETLARRGIPGRAGGEVSLVSIDLPSDKLDGRHLGYRFKAALQLHGVDVPGLRMIVSAVHSAEDVERTLEAFDAAVGLLQDEGVVS